MTLSNFQSYLFSISLI